jgi:hypothetical protein
VIIVLGIATIGLGVASVVAEKNPETIFSSSTWQQNREFISNAYTGVALKSREAVTYLGQLKDRFLSGGEDVYQAARDYLKPYVDAIHLELSKAENDPVAFVRAA